MKVCIIAEAYPYDGEPRFPFVQQLAYSLSNENCECYVIAPQSITRNLLGRGKKKPYHSIDTNPENKEIHVYRPSIISFSNTKSRVLSIVYEDLFCSSIKRALRDIGDCDALYCYFWHVGLRTIKAVKARIPVFVQASECEITVPKSLRKKEYLDRVTGIICASGKNRDESVAERLTKEENTIIAVNGYRSDEFYIVDKNEARKKLGYSEDIFIVAFLGGFIKRKGLPQLCHVLDRFNDVYSIFIGQGEIQPTCKNILFKGALDHKDIVWYLNCADVFVLPTEAEGCCNAIIEALACGLPVISSNKSFNNEILNDECSIRIDEQNEQEILNAIELLKNDSNLRKRMSLEASIMAETLTIDKRAKKIKAYLKSSMKETNNGSV